MLFKINVTMPKKILLTLQQIFHEDLPQTVQMQDHISKFEIDSLRLLQMVVKIEEHWSIRIPDDRIIAVRTVGDLVQLVVDSLQTK